MIDSSEGRTTFQARADARAIDTPARIEEGTAPRAVARLRELLGDRRVARLQGAFNMAGGLWPVFHMRSFEAITGRKRDRWLVKTVGLLLAVIGGVEASSRQGEDASNEAAALGVGTAAALLAIDVVYVARKRISKVYLLDGLAQVVWIAAWFDAKRRRATTSETPTV